MQNQGRLVETGSKSLDLSFDDLGHFDRGSVGNVTIGPTRMLAWRGPRWIEKTLLRNQDVGVLRVDTSVDLRFRRRDFLKRATEVNGTGLPTLLALPRNGTIQCPVELEDARR